MTDLIINAKISFNLFFAFNVFCIFAFGLWALNTICQYQTSSFTTSVKAAHAVLSKAASQDDKAVQGGHRVGNSSPDIMKAFTRRCV